MRALLGVLGSVSLLILSGNLLLLWLSWVGTSLALHQLLVFFHERPQAIITAHKKFLISRLADLSLLVAFLLIGKTIGSFQLDHLDNWARTHAELPPAMSWAALLLVVGACLKSAQLPFHGWLLQVMEAPTPVSALLHAGVVNLGGVLMIRLAPLMARAPVAQMVLVIVGTATAVLAALVMTTRVSVKVMLAWSTCAQMGFMLVECGLGAWRLALLHLVAHSAYKAHAFLGSGGVVAGWCSTAPMPHARAPTLRELVGGISIIGTAALIAAMTLSLLGQAGSGLLALTPLVGLSLLPLSARLSFGGWRSWTVAALSAAGLSAVYLGWHLITEIFPVPIVDSQLSPARLAVVLVGATPLICLQVMLILRPSGRSSQALHQWLFAGLYLDERFTRLTFWLWPPKLGPKERRASAPALAVLQEN